MTYILGDRVIGQADGSGNVTYLLVDGHGSTRALTDASGAITKTFNYDAFGTALNFTPASAGTAFLFGGDAIYDPVSGLYMHGDGTRDRIGFRFIQRDTYDGNKQDPLSLHKYLYANGDPVNMYDPSGHSALDVCITMGLISVLSLIDYSLIRGAIQTGTHWNGIAGSTSLSGGQGGYDVTRQLVNLRQDALMYWQKEPGAQQDLQLSYLGLMGRPLTGWDVDEFFKNQQQISPLGTAFGTVTVNDRVYWQDEVNYYWYGIITRLSDMRQQAVTGVPSNTIESACTRIATYRTGLWGATLITGRQAWARAGYYGDFNYARGQNLAQFDPSGPYSGALNGHFGKNSDSDPNATFVAVGAAW